ncbi:MAG: chitobiase/beta-hexosaminidase C-terminal domain-containing protein, partial [Flavobacteriales bacterium]
ALFLTFQVSAQFIRINECQASNGTSFIDEADDFDDWIELYNLTDEPVDLSSWSITDDPDNLIKWQFPTSPESIVPAGGYLILIADNEEDEGLFHLNFSLKQSGEEILLVKPDMNIEHQIAYSFCLQDFSWGYNESNTWSLLDLPSPGFENVGAGFNGAADRPSFSMAGQVLDAPTSIELTAGESAEIYFTLDGSEPTNSSTLYTDPISIDETSTVKAIAIEPGKYNSLVNAQSYLFGADHHNPIIHLSCLEDLFNGPNGLDNQPSDDNELVLAACFFDESGQQIHQQTMGMKVHAADFRDQRSFRLYARGQYGESKLNLDIYPERDFDQHKRLVLRNAGNDGLEIAGSALRDPLISGLYQSIDPSYGASAYKPVNIYINGEYRGLYNLRERQDEDWLENVYNVEPDEVDFLERTAGESDTRNEISGVW